MTKEPDRNQRKALGKGLSALLPNRNSAPEPASPQMAAAEHAAPNLPDEFEEFQNVAIEEIQPGEQQPRRNFEEARLDELADSIRVHGVIQPITLRKVGPREYRIVAGERRWRAAKLAGLKEIPALVRRVKQEELLELALIENIQREDLNPIEIANAFNRLNTTYGLSHEQIAERTGKDRSTVTNFLRLLKLIPPVKQELANGNISMGHARALLNLQPAEQARICERIQQNGLSVRETEALVREISSPREPAGPPQTTRLKEVTDPNVRAAIEEMSMALGTKVRIVPRSDKAGRLEIEYYSQEDLDRIYSVIVK
ncbi:MAG TPA: ParB/RepB/Spo0J family partition protein [Bryobacteraceae bacterium]|jgi:ParB family chromosome partitioning protein|nr:ParB/RepB/Spo0J family partition protein [Bryobacteraceae bacterium]